MDEETRRIAVQVCKDYLGGVWANVTTKDIIIEEIRGGFRNNIVKLSLPETIPLISSSEPRQIVMKTIPKELKRKQFAIMTENVIVTLLASNHLTAKVYGIFDGGRLDEFLPSRVSTAMDYKNPLLLEAIVRKIARFHSLNVPISKIPNCFTIKIKDLLDASLNDIPNQIKNDERKKDIWDDILTLNPREELKWLLKLRDESNSPIVFSHNDLTMHNILVATDNCLDPIHLIDFEESGYNYRGHDFATFFVMFTNEFLQEPPYFATHHDRFPSLEELKFIFNIYVNEIGIQKGITLNAEREVELLLKEFKVFVLIFSFWGIFFCLVSPRTIKNVIDWIPASKNGLKNYLIRKKMLFNI